MPKRQLQITGIGEVLLTKRKGMRSIRLSLTQDGLVRVSMPSWVPYASGLKFLQTKRAWVEDELAKRRTSPLRDGDRIGKAHRLRVEFASSSNIQTRLVGQDIRVLSPPAYSLDDEHLQQRIKKACLKALKKESDRLLPQRLQRLAETHSLPYASSQIRVLKRRWGSCDERQRITLNLYLIQLPWHLIDYVLLHELVHTKVMNHGPSFWNQLETLSPGARQLRKELNTYQPTLMQTNI